MADKQLRAPRKAPKYRSYPKLGFPKPLASIATTQPAWSRTSSPKVRSHKPARIQRQMLGSTQIWKSPHRLTVNPAQLLNFRGPGVVGSGRIRRAAGEATSARPLTTARTSNARLSGTPTTTKLNGATSQSGSGRWSTMSCTIASFPWLTLIGRRS